MVLLAQRWAEKFMDRNPEISVQVSGGGSGTGLTALIDGTTDIATASRSIAPKESERIVATYGGEPHETPVAIDAVALYVHRDNPVPALGLPQTKEVFRGRVLDWSALGVPLGHIVLYSRENNSGTYTFFKETVLENEDFAAEAQTLPGTAAVINAVSRDLAAIGYGGIGFASGARIVPIALEDGTAISPNAETARNGTYPLARPLFLYTAGPIDETAQRYVDFALSAEGQTLVEDLGYFPLPIEGPIAGGRG